LSCIKVGFVGIFLKFLPLSISCKAESISLI